MLTSLAYLFLLGMVLGSIFQKLKLPRLLGMLITGIILGPYTLNILDPSLLYISEDLRKLALIIILARAGLALNIADLKKVGRPAVLMCFLPACFEIMGVILIAPYLLGISTLDAAIMGSVLAAVSPAVIVPKMIHLIEAGYGTKQSIPQMIMASASVDDVFVIVLFTSFTGLAQGKSFSVASLTQIPLSIFSGVAAGIALGFGLVLFFKYLHLRDTSKVLLVLSFSFLLIALETALENILPFSGLLAVMSVGATLQKQYPQVSTRLSAKFSKLWVAAEVLLFVLVGATVDLKYAASAGLAAIIVIFTALAFRMIGVLLCMVKTSLSFRERVFCMIAYLPKATVQAAIGAIPLSMGLPCGKIILTVAVLAILITAPLGAIGIDLTYTTFLQKNKI